MEEQIFFLNMFPDYEPPEELYAALSQAAIAAADIDPETRSVHVALHSERYIPQRLLEQVRKDICGLYGLQKLELTATHPESELQKIEPEELMWLFVSRNSMARGSLAGAKWEWNEQNAAAVAAGNADVGLPRFAGAVDHAAHHGHGQGLFAGGERLLHLIGKANEVNARPSAGRAGDDVHAVLTQASCF